MNRLAGEPSAYLRQHAQNPLHWQPFDDAAFAEAAARDVPIFLSIGYAACHWCHVMAGESFTDPTIAALVNERFVAIKVDREERPDVDDAYMAATQALSGQGGWPMSVFLTPDGRAFYAGTYFAPQPGPGRPSFRQVLEAVHEAWIDRRELVETTAEDLARALANPVWQIQALPSATDDGSAQDTAIQAVAVHSTTADTSPWLPTLANAVQALAEAEDPVHGGLGGAPKFPPTPVLEFLIRHAAAGAGESSQRAAGVAGRTLSAMVNSALFDQLGGGFARYSVTADFSEPHYEKMLYDNAGLLRVLVHWIRLAESNQELPEGVISTADARRAAHATADWLGSELRLPTGAYASSLDADTVLEGVHYEGASYHWTMNELRAAAQEATSLDDAAEALAMNVASFMNIPASGSGAPFHPGRALSPDERATWELIAPALWRRRAQRTMPARDDKVVASWNGLLVAALAEAGMILHRADYLRAATELGAYLELVHWDGHLYRVSHDGRARGIKGLLEDYAGCATGFLALYAATGGRRWIDFARRLLEALEAEFMADGVVLNNASPGALAGSRFADPFDAATASGVALAAEAFTTWAAYTGSHRHRELSRSMLASLPELARQAPRAAGGLLAVATAVASGPLEVAMVGSAGSAMDALLEVAWASPSPGVVIATWDGVGDPPVPLVEGRAPAPGQGAAATRAGAGTGVGTGSSPALAYVCRNMVCERPVSLPGDLAALLH